MKVRIGMIAAGVAFAPFFTQLAHADTKLKFMLDYSVTGYHAPFYLAKAKGWYKEAGLDVSITPGKGSAGTIQNLAARTTDMAFADYVGLGRAVESGMPLIAVAAIVRDSLACIVSFGEKPVRKPKDLEGKSLGGIPTGIAAYVLPAFYRANGVDASKVKLISYNYGATVPSLLSGQVDSITGFYITEFNTVRNRMKNREVVVMRFVDHGIIAYSNGLIANTNFLKENPKAVDAFVDVSLKALRYSLEHIDEAIGATAQNTETSPVVLKQQFELAVPFIVTDENKKLGWGNMVADHWKKTQQLQIDAGIQKKPMGEEVLWTNRFTKN
ncbi:MAG: ABC transporter substrate-binding protein [Hyphomicrobiaceae bacterium]